MINVISSYMQDCLLLDCYTVAKNILKVQIRVKVPPEFGGYFTVNVMAAPSILVLFFFQVNVKS